MTEEKINFGGKEATASTVEVNQTSERWNEYLLEDGSLLKMKLIVKKVLRVHDQFDAEGNPVYLVQSTNVTSVTAPKNLRKGGQAEGG